MSEIPAELDRSDRCFRCEYDLRGIADDQPCPECGLLAERSRRKTEHLADASPKWLRRISLGLFVMLLSWFCAIGWYIGAIAFAAAWGSMIFRAWVEPETLLLSGTCIAAVVFIVGVFLFTAPEAMVTDNVQDQRRRRLMRKLAFLPLIGCVVATMTAEARRFGRIFFFGGEYTLYWSFVAVLVVVLALYMLTPPLRRLWSFAVLISMATAMARLWFPAFLSSREYSHNPYLLFILRSYGPTSAVILLTFGCVPLPLLLFGRLSFLSERTLSRRASEHSMIVGYGFSGTLLAVPLLLGAYQLGQRLGGAYWDSRSNLSLLIVLTILVLLILFFLWSAFAMFSGALAFRRAAKARRKAWSAADRSAPPG